MPTSPLNYHLVCGMEIHAELKTESKMFCGCKNDPFFADAPNTHTCPVCLGMPGGLPVANKRAIEWTIKLGLALGCQINLFSHFDRKNYFYPDLPKGYQISQYDQPFCFDGKISTPFGDVRIRRIHLEEDTAKMIHRTVDGKKVSLIDFNRSSVPLVEVVTEPDIKSAEQAKAYAKSLRQILRYLDIADCDMEQGGMRLEANISLSPDETLPNYKVELKNINSFRFMEKAIAFEMKRQEKVLREGQTPPQETRGWNEAKGETFIQRTKEDAEDYRYFPDPDIPPLRFTKEQIEAWRNELPELPTAVVTRWQKEFGVESKYGELLFESQAERKWAEALFSESKQKNVDANALANAIANKKIVADASQPAANVVATFQALTKTDDVPETEIRAAAQQVISANADAVASYKAGKTQVIGFFIGQTTKQIGKKLDPKRVAQILQEMLSSS